MSLLSTLPLLLALIGALATGWTALRRKSLAQALCLKSGMQLQLALKTPLEKLLRLNPKAERLRSARVKADHAVMAATASGIVPAITAGKAEQTAVILAQASLRAMQERLLLEAEYIRRNGARELHGQIESLKVQGLQNPRHFMRPLAVQPQPANSASPNYEPIPEFSLGQQQDVSFDLNLIAGLPFSDLSSAKQKTKCSVSLKEEDGQWKLRILAANAPSSWL